MNIDFKDDQATMSSIQGQQTSDAEKQQHGEQSRQRDSSYKSLGWLDRFLAVWILLAMIIGVLLGNFVEQTGPALQKGKFVGVSIPIGKKHHCDILVLLLTSPLALGLLVMMYPILCKVRYETLHLVFKQRTLWVQIGFSVVMNWIIAPLLMVSHSWSVQLGMNTADRSAWPCLGFSTRQKRIACRIDISGSCKMYRHGSSPLLSPPFLDI
jgi:hypothetical protein